MHKMRRVGILFALFTQVDTALASGDVEIFRPDDGKQCIPNSGRTVSSDATLLSRAGISTIFHAEKKLIPFVIASPMCGYSSHMANVFVISSKDWEKHGAILARDPYGFALWPANGK
jgi:hypothetical protein